MKRFYSTLLLTVAFSLAMAQDTFSIVALDPATGEIGSAGASCVPGIGEFGGVILLSGILPGRGGLNAQAYICIDPHINLDNGMARLQEGLSPQEVLDWLADNDACAAQDYDPAYRQYGAVAIGEGGTPSAAAFTGQSADDWKGHRTGATYAIQGNILKGPEVLDGMEQAFTNTEGSLAERLMAAMQGANVVGADARCTEAGTSSTSAFLRVFRPGDAPDDPYLELNVAEAPSGIEPIDSLQALFDEWALTGSRGGLSPDAPHFRAYPNPAQGQIRLVVEAAEQDALLRWYDTKGQLAQTDRVSAGWQDVNCPAGQGVYWLCLCGKNGQIWQRERLLLMD